MTDRVITTTPEVSEQDRQRRIAAMLADLNALGDSAARAAGFAWRWAMQGIDPQELRLARRAYALRNHPDLASTDDERKRATRRIGRVNAAIDRAIAEARTHDPTESPASQAQQTETQRCPTISP